MTTDLFRNAASGRSFAKAVKFLAKRGGSFDAKSKLWVVPANAIDEGEAELFGLVKVSAPDSYRDWSDNPNSIL